jgi:ABC-2 type transport system ATP-binding protein
MNIGIEVSDLHKRMRRTPALAGVSATFESGALHGLIGPDGAGKTTLLRLLMGLLKPDSGEIRFMGDGTQVPFAEVRTHVAYMPQQQSLYPDLSVGEHLDFFRDLYRIPPDVYRSRREDLLRLARLTEFTDRPAAKLSGGMYKKLGLLCALLRSPAVILLDEPTNGVDPISRRELWDLLYRQVEAGVLVLLSTAYMDEAERCGKVHVLDGGLLLASGEPRAVLAKEGAPSFEELFMRREKATAT